MDGISVLYSVLSKLEELDYTTSNDERYFILRYEHLKDMPGEQLYEILQKLKKSEIISCDLDFTLCNGRYLHIKNRPPRDSYYFKIKLLDSFYEYYIKIKKEFRIEHQLTVDANKKSKFKLSKRQLEVLQLYSDGYKTREEIAEVIGIKATTVRTHEDAIMKKLKTGTIQQSIKVAAKNGLIN